MLVDGGGGLNSSENEKWYGLNLVLLEGEGSWSLKVDSLESELVESDSPEWMVFAVG